MRDKMNKPFVPYFEGHSKIAEVRHPDYLEMRWRWDRWRRTYEAGHKFKDYYLVKFSERENPKEFNHRKNITYVPAFAKAAINDIKNAVFQRMHDIVRIGGPDTYQDAMMGRSGGVDFAGSTMNSFIGRKILPELLALGKVGIYVDSPEVNAQMSMFDQKDIRPYMYMYRTEDILSWNFDQKGELVSVLLRDRQFVLDPVTNLPAGISLEERFRFIHKDPVTGHILIGIFNEQGELLQQVDLDLPRLPFVILQLCDSLLADAADYQIAHMNLASSDLAYALKSNMPFYVEQYNPFTENVHAKHPDPVREDADPDDPLAIDDGDPRDSTIRTGATQGRRVPIGVQHMPQFINPSSEPLKVSMEKQEVIKEEIRLLVNLAVSNLKPAKVASAESKTKDDSGLESGLSYIGLELEQAEREIGEIWTAYTGAKEAPTVNYPEKYSLKSDEDRRKDVEALSEMLVATPSMTYKRHLGKLIAEVVLGHRVTHKTMEEIFKELENATFFDGDPKNIQQDVNLGIASRSAAATARGWPEGTAEAANKEHGERLALISESQSKDNETENSAARGNPDGSADPKTAAEDEKSSSQDPDKNTESRVRGDGK